MKHFIPGAILLAIGLTIISPFEEMLILIPLSTYLNMPELIVIFNVMAILALAGAVVLLGVSKVTGPFHKHWKMVIVGVAIFIIYAVWWLG